jgi:hypothetical protein
MKHEVPPNIGKVRVAVTLGNKYVVWNGKQGRGEFKIACRDKRQAAQLAQQINQLREGGTVEVD